MYDLIREFDLGHLARKQVGGLSGGQKRLVGACLSFAGNPKLVLLDEPTTGLDSLTLAAVAERTKEFRAGRTTVVITSAATWAANADKVVTL